MKKIPFKQTTISVSKSIGQIKSALYEVGFTRILEMGDENNHSILIAEYGQADKTAQFQFEAHTGTILKSITTGRSRDRLELKNQAARIAWRLVSAQVKAICDSIKLDIISIPEGFGSNMLLTDGSGKKTKLSDFVLTNMLNGKLVGKSFSDTFLLENKL